MIQILRSLSKPMEAFQPFIPNGPVAYKNHDRKPRYSFKDHSGGIKKADQTNHRGVAAYRTVGKLPPTLKYVKLYLALSEAPRLGRQAPGNSAETIQARL